MGRALWRPVREFAGADGSATYFWPRWLVLRLVGVVFLIAFGGILSEGIAMVGPNGLAPIGGYLAQVAAKFGSRFAAFWHAPSLFWFGASAGAIRCVAGAGLVSALALTFNVAPRWALAACWVALLSFVSSWQLFTSTQVDQLALETALLSIPLAPAGWRPGLGAASPPRPLALFMLRWMLFRVMFECGVIKLVAGDYHWFDFSAMDVLYETAPFPTPLAFWDHQLPHAWHAIEAGLTFAAELAAPLVAIWGGRRGRWFAFVIWTLFQAGIQLTCNFGWLNTAALTLGLMLLDDQMIAALGSRLKIKAALPLPASSPSKGRWSWQWTAVGVALWVHFALTIETFASTLSPPAEDSWRAKLDTAVIDPWYSVNAYTLYGSLLPWRYSVDFAGSNDGGKTWRMWRFRHQPQEETDISGFIAPWYCRFEATLQAQANSPEPKEIFVGVAAHLIARTPEVMRLFEGDPFPDRPPGLVRIRGYRMKFVDARTHAATGKYWKREDVGDFRPMMFRDEDGRILPAKNHDLEIRAFAVNGNAEAQSALGLMYSGAEGHPEDLATAVKWYRRAAEQGDPTGELSLGMSYLTGDGVAVDKTAGAHWLQLAAEQGNVPAQFNLGMQLYHGDGVPRDRPRALVWFSVAAALGDAASVRVRDAIAAEVGPAAAAEASRASRALVEQINRRPAKTP